MTRALRRAAASHLLVAAAALVVTAGLAGAAVYRFTADTQHQPSTFAGGWVAAATGLGTPTVSGYDAGLAWTPGSHGVTGQELWGADQNTTASCAGASYASLATLGAATASTTDANRGSTLNGHWYCYEIRSTHASWWTPADFAPVLLGLVPTQVAIGPGRSAGQVSNNATIAITFNQATNVPANGGTFTVCVFGPPDNVLLLGDPGCASASDTPSIGKLTGLTIAGTASWAGSTVAVSGSTVTVTVNDKGNTRVSASGTATFAASPSVLSAATVDQAQACTTAPNCTPTASGAF
jgi:hypothetical protein